MKIVIYNISYLYGKHPASSAFSQSVLYQVYSIKKRQCIFLPPCENEVAMAISICRKGYMNS